MENVPFTRTEPDIENDIRLSEELQKELEALEKEGTHPLTIIRGGAAAAFLNQEGTSIEIAESRKIEPYNVTSWASAYRNGGGIEALKRMEKRPIKMTKSDPNHDKRLSTYLKMRLEAIEKEGGHPDTIKRVRVVAAVLSHEFKNKEIMASENVSQSNLSSWKRAFINRGFQALIAMEKTPTKKAIRNTDANKKHAENLQKSFETYKKKGCDSETINKVEAVVDFLNGVGSSNAIAKQRNLSKDSIVYWKKVYINKDIEALMKALTRKPIAKAKKKKKSSQPTEVEVATTPKSPQMAVKESAAEHRKGSSDSSNSGDFDLSKLAKTPENPNKQNPSSRKRKRENSLANDATRIMH